MIPDNNILDIIISLTLIYALLSILVSILLEWWNQWRKSRAALLRKSIHRLLNDDLNFDFGQLFYNHYMIDGMRNEEKRPPQYISSRMFTEVVIDIIANRLLHNQPIKLETITSEGKQFVKAGEIPKDVIARFKVSLNQLHPSPLIDTLESFCDKAHGNYETLKKLISDWYDDYQDRVTGLYKFKQRNPLIVFGFVVAITLNVDSLHLIKMISLDDNLRKNLVTNAEKMADQYNQLADSAKQKTKALEKIMLDVFPDTAIRNADGKLLYTTMKDSLRTRKKDLVNRYASTLDSLFLSDSLSVEYKQRVDRVLNITSELNIPVGWSTDAAPLVWIYSQSNMTNYPPEINSRKQDALFAYINTRNTQSWGNYLLYVAGIIISGISLSFGAPFWFETMTKLINLRRSGIRPKTADEKK